jgi:plastocyanin
VPLLRSRVLAVLLASAALLASCGDDDDDEAASDDTTTSTAAAGASDEAVTVTAVDYKFEDLPAEIEAGTKLGFKNESTKEAHELVAFRIPDTENRPVSELVVLPEAEQTAIFGEGPPALVVLAGPGGEPIYALGDGTLTEPGRYAAVCFIPTGADPQAYLEAAGSESEGPPNVEGGPPHTANGMFAEFKVA